MDDNLLYWIIEYGKVLVTYGILMFVWPSIVFRKWLKGKSATIRFAFCSIMQVVLINTVVLVLGLFHILNEWTVSIVFYGVLIWSLRKELVISAEERKSLYCLITGTYGWKNWLLKRWQKIEKPIRAFFGRIFKFYRKNWLEYSLLIVMAVYAMIYFSYGAFQDHSYGCGDLYVHHTWIYELTEGNIFSDGVYPEGMHCFIYCMHILGGVDIYSCLLFLASIHIVVTLVAAYCFMKEVFKSRYSAIFVLLMFLTVSLEHADEVFSMARMQWTIPQEFGFYSMYLGAMFFIRYLNSENYAQFRNKKTKFCWDINLFLFAMAFATSIIIHFYVTMMAFFICLAFVIVKLKKVFNKKYLVPLLISLICGTMIAILPMAGALASGIPFQKSIGWAMGVMDGTNTEDGRSYLYQEENETNITYQPTTPMENTGTVNQGGSTSVEVQEPSAFEVIWEKISSTFERIWMKIVSFVKMVANLVKDKMEGVYEFGYLMLYKQTKANWIIAFSLFAGGVWLLYRMVTFVLRKIFKKTSVDGASFDVYLALVITSFFFIALYAAPFIGLPELIAGARLCTTGQMFVLMVIIVPIDILFAQVGRIKFQIFLHMLAAAGFVGIFATIWCSGNYHGYLFYELTRYNVAVELTNEIMDSLPEHTYTIVSTTDEIYQVIQNGRHEEVLTFLQKQGGERYTIPTEHVFFYVEKKPIVYAQMHFFKGPKWLAHDKYQDIYLIYSECPNILAEEISKEAAQKEILTFTKLSDTYASVESRVIVESKIYEWCEKFKTLYPYELKTYYEDENFVCYYLKQNTEFLYNLEIE